MRRPIRRILTPGERQALRAQERELIAQLETPTFQMGPSGPVRVADISGLERPHEVRGELSKTRKILEEGSPQDLTRGEKGARERAIRILEERIRSKMIPEKQFKMAKDDSTEYRKVVDELVRQGMDSSLSKDIEDLKNMRRERDPDNPSAGSIEDLRRS